MNILRWLAALLLPVLSGSIAFAKVDPDIEREVGGLLSNECSDPSNHPMVRLYGDTMSVEWKGKKVAAKTFKTLRQSPLQPPPADFKVAFQGEVPGGDGLLFVMTHNRDGLFVTIVGGAKSLATLGPGIVGMKLRHCDPNRNALPGAPTPAQLPDPTALLKDARFKKAYFAALGPLGQEPWLRTLNGPAPQSQEIVLAGQKFIKAAVCKLHDCQDNNLVMLWEPSQGSVYLQIHTRGRDQTLGQPPQAIAIELPRIWKQEWRQ